MSAKSYSSKLCTLDPQEATVETPSMLLLLQVCNLRYSLRLAIAIINICNDFSGGNFGRGNLGSKRFYSQLRARGDWKKAKQGRIEVRAKVGSAIVLSVECGGRRKWGNGGEISWGGQCNLLDKVGGEDIWCAYCYIEAFWAWHGATSIKRMDLS